MLAVLLLVVHVWGYSTPLYSLNRVRVRRVFLVESVLPRLPRIFQPRLGSGGLYAREDKPP